MDGENGTGGGGLWAALIVGVVLGAAGLALRLDDTLTSSSHKIAVFALALGGLLVFVAGTGLGVMLGVRAATGRR